MEDYEVQLMDTLAHDYGREKVNFFNKIYDLLISEAQISKSHKSSFIMEHCHKNYPTEFRIGGVLGFGGKFWRNDGRLYVSCYSEDENDEKRDCINRINQELETMQKDLMENACW